MVPVSIVGTQGCKGKGYIVGTESCSDSEGIQCAVSFLDGINASSNVFAIGKLCNLCAYIFTGREVDWGKGGWSKRSPV